jgi:uridine kinase
MIIIGISGGSASGKSTLSKKIINFFSKKKIVVEHLQLDNYYKDLKFLSKSERNSKNFDHPDSIDFKLFYQHLTKLSLGNYIDTPTYSYKTHLRKNKTNRIEKVDLLIIDGLFILLKEKIRDFFDLTIFLDVNSDSRLLRRIKRDVKERSGNKNYIRDRFKNIVEPMHQKYVEPSKKFADMIVKDISNCKVIFKKIELKINKIDKKNKKI